MEQHIRRQCIEKYGEKFNFDMLKEECGELITSISHYERGKTTKEEVVGEIVDVHLMLMITLDILDPEGDCLPIIKADKISRVLDRLEAKECQK